MKTKFTKALFLLTLTLSWGHGQSQVMCTDIVPDTVISIAPGATAQYTFDLDLNNDGTKDFRISMVQNNMLGFINVQATQIGTNNAVLANGSNTALALPIGTAITPTSNTWVQMNGSNQQMMIFAFGPPGGSFPGMGDRCLGFRFLIGANTHYGWARFNIPNVGNTMTCYDYGYNATPNASISAGQICPAPPTPSFNIVSPMCDGASQTITANTGTVVAAGYTWSAAPAGPVFSAPNASTTGVSIGAPGIFSITLAVNDGTLTGNVTHTVQVNTVPVFTITSTHTMLCSGETATITALGANTYSWAGGPNTSTYAVSPTSTTVYTITGATAGNCTNSAQFTQSVTVCSGIAQFGSNKASFSVYPNPMNDQLFFSISLAEPMQSELVVKDLLGKTILTEAVQLPQGNSTHAINTAKFKPGIYFVSMRSNGGSQTIKVIKE